MTGVCVGFALPIIPGSVPRSSADDYLAAARASLADDLVAAVLLTEPESGGAGALVGSRQRQSLEAHFAASHLQDSCRHAVGGIPEAAFGSGVPDGNGDDAYLTVVVDQNDPPIPFDDPAVIGVFREQLAWYFPLVGDRHAACGALLHDGVRARGAYMLFRAESLDAARYLSMLDPWRRVGPGWLFTMPLGVFAEHPAPPGPGTQRSGSPVCGGIDSTAEPRFEEVRT